MATVGQTFQSNMVHSHQPQIFTFLKGQPKALGTIQIMIGLITLLFGIVLVSDPPYAPISVLSGNVFWASIFYIITGSLSVAAESNIQNCLVQGSLGMNVVSALMSAAGIGLLTTDFFLYYYCNSFEDCYRFEARSKSISAVLLVFTILQFIISISISVFACKATCALETMVPIVTYTNQAVSGNPQVPVSTFGNQAFQGGAHNVVYIPQTQGNHMSNAAPQNFHGWSHSR